MKIPHSDPDPRCENLLRQARSEVSPPLDIPALLRVVRHAPLGSQESWAVQLSEFFSSWHVIPGCLAGAMAFALLATWQAWDSWQTLPWVQLLDAAAGGAS
jgi:hypothetical protein